MKLQGLLLLVVLLASVAALSSTAALYLVHMQSESQTDLLRRVEALEKEVANRPSPQAEAEKTQDARRLQSMVQAQISELHDHQAALAERVHKLSQAIQSVPQTEPKD